MTGARRRRPLLGGTLLFFAAISGLLVLGLAFTSYAFIAGLVATVCAYFGVRLLVDSEPAGPAYVFNPPPGWPAPPPGWRPTEGWQPDPSWPEPPAGWKFWRPTGNDAMR